MLAQLTPRSDRTWNGRTAANIALSFLLMFVATSSAAQSRAESSHSPRRGQRLQSGDARELVGPAPAPETVPLAQPVPGWAHATLDASAQPLELTLEWPHGARVRATLARATGETVVGRLIGDPASWVAVSREGDEVLGEAYSTKLGSVRARANLVTREVVAETASMAAWRPSAFRPSSVLATWVGAPVAEAGATSFRQVSVVVLSTSRAVQAAGGLDSITARTSNWFALTNLALHDAGTGVRLRLEGIEVVQHVEEATTEADLAVLQAPSGPLSARAANAKARVGADAVCLLVDGRASSAFGPTGAMLPPDLATWGLLVDEGGSDSTVFALRPAPNPDLNNDGQVDAADIAMLVAAIGPCQGECAADLSGDSRVDVADLTLLMEAQSRGVGDPCYATDQIVLCQVCPWLHVCKKQEGDSGSMGGLGNGPGVVKGGGPGKGEEGTGGNNCVVAIDGCPNPPYVQLPADGDPVQLPLIALASAGAQYAWSTGATSAGIQLVLGSPGRTEVMVTATTLKGDSCSDTAEVTAFLLDLDVDSDNTSAFAAPSGSAEEEEAEEGSGAKVIIVNRMDVDHDGVPDFADGYGAFNDPRTAEVEAARFVPLSLKALGIDANHAVALTLTYSDSDPGELVRQIVDVPEIQSTFHRHLRPDGLLRVWKKDASEPRTIADFVASGDQLDLAEVDPGLVLYLEAVSGSSTAVTIEAVLNVGNGVTYTDSIRVLPFDAVTGLDEKDIAGFTILHGSAQGGPGREIILGTKSDDQISAGDGDDIIVAGAGDDTIDAGAGADVVFAFAGSNVVTFGSSSGFAQRGGDGGGSEGEGNGDDTLLPEYDRPFTIEQVRAVYAFMYGANDPWLHVFDSFEKVGWRIEVVEGDGIPFSGSDIDTINAHSVEVHTGYIIQLEFSLECPFVAATHLRKHLLTLADVQRFRDRFAPDELALARRADLLEDQQLSYDQVRQIAYDNTIASIAAIAELYVSAITIVSEGADIVFSIGELAEGNYSAAIAFLPLVTGTNVRAVTAVLRKADGSALMTKVGDVFIGAESGIGFVYRREMPVSVVESAVAPGRFTVILGTAQAIEGSTHAATINRRVGELAESGQYEYITMNRSWGTATGRISEVDSHPDIIAIRRNGTVDVIEVRSPSQNADQLLARLNAEMSALPKSMRGTTLVVELDP